MIQLAAGYKVRHFEVIERLGEGAMGEVFKARDLHLRRFIALKALKPGLMGAAARERFFREARVASALNHPNIVTIFDAFTEDDTDFIAMEFITGTTLRHLIAEGPLPLADVLEFALQIADALHAANRADVVHRDLKPGNIMVTEDRIIKVLDFGLAKFSVSTHANSDTASLSPDTCQTTPGTILGTVAYMAPEQAEGKQVDARSDIFSFGTILYEMLTGRQAFHAETIVSTLVAILTQEPRPLSELSPNLPKSLHLAVTKCLRKDADLRFQTASELRAVLRDARAEAGGFAPPSSSHSALSQVQVPWKWIAGIAAIFAIAAVAAVWLYRSRPNTGTGAPTSVLARAIPLTAYRGNEATPSFSPDGTQIAFSWDGEGRDNSDIYVKLVGPGRPVRITTDPRPDICPSWSRDGRSIAFLRQLSENEASLIVMPALGGRERTLLNLETPYILGASKPAWSKDSKWLVISTAKPGENLQGLARVSLEDGKLTWITQPDAASGLNAVMPALSPNGRRLAYSRVGGGFLTAAFVLPVSDDLSPAGEPKALEGRISALMPEWLNDEDLIVATGGVQSTLWRINAAGKAPAQPLVVPGTDVVQPTIQPSANRLAYVSKTLDSNIWTIDLAGKTQTSGEPRRIIASTQSDVNPQVSPDGKVAFSSNRAGNYDIWVWAADAPDAYQLTAMGAGTTGSPRWSPSGREIAFDSNVEGRSNIYVVNSDGGTPRKLTQGEGANIVPCWSTDGKSIFFGSSRSGTSQIWKMNADGSNPVMITQRGGFAPLQSENGEFIFYAKSPALASDIWKVSSSGGEERKIADGVFRYSFAVAPAGLYFVSAPAFQKGSYIRFLEFSGEKITDVLPLREPAALGLGLSSDYRHLFFAKVDQSESDIMLVENIH